DSLLNQDRIITSGINKFGEQSAKLLLHPPDTKGEDGKLLFADENEMNKTFIKIFSRPRSHMYSERLKQQARDKIIARFEEYGFEVTTQKFKYNQFGFAYNGINIIAVKNGLNRGKAGDEIILVGGHYDTVESSPGVDDNGSGMVAVLETARVLSSVQLKQTIMFVAFDLEELGLLGSLAFVRDYLIPLELVKNGANFLGAFITDMVLRQEPDENSQKLPTDVEKAVPNAAAQIKANQNRGDFIAVWSRKSVDYELWQSLSKSRSQLQSSLKFKLIEFDCPLPATRATASELRRYGTFTRSDHASFWYHKNANYPSTLNAVLLTDMGPWRGELRRCYHSYCDDTKQLTANNLNFLKQTVDTLIIAITKNPPKKGVRPRTRPRTRRPSSFHLKRFFNLFDQKTD
ncbi:uncharacterized protein B4U79_02535, partial [Dinothrombium tinctorium]